MNKIALLATITMLMQAESAVADFSYIRVHDRVSSKVAERIFGLDDSRQIGLFFTTRDSEQVIHAGNAAVSLVTQATWCADARGNAIVEWNVKDLADEAINKKISSSAWRVGGHQDALYAPDSVSAHLFTALANAKTVTFHINDGCGQALSYSYSLNGFPAAVLELNLTNSNNNRAPRN